MSDNPSESGYAMLFSTLIAAARVSESRLFYLFRFSGQAGTELVARLHLAIDDAVARGSLTSLWFRQETGFVLQLAARSRRNNVIPIVVAPFAHNALTPHLANIQWFGLTTGPFDAWVEKLIRV